MSTPIQPVPDIVLASEFPTLADRPAGTYNAKAAAWANSENAMAQSVREVALNVENNAIAAGERALEAEASANAAAGTVDTVEGYKNDAEASAASAAADAVKTAADRQAVEQALIEGPVLSVNGEKGVVELDADDVGAVPQGGSAFFSRYDLASGEVTDTLDLAVMQVFRIDASTPRTLSFANEPGADRAMTVVVHITGNEAVTWPAGIDWDSDAAPELGDNETKVVLFWDGVEWSGFVRVAK